jgi:phage terminase large subunit-like protein
MGRRGPGSGRLKAARGGISAQDTGVENSTPPPSTLAGQIIKFCEWLPITKGPLAGQKMQLLPFQKEFIQSIYDSPTPIRLALQSCPRGNGKSGLLAALTLAHLLGPCAEKRGECYSVASDLQQAAILFNEMEAIILAVPELAVWCNIQRFHKRIEALHGPGEGSVYAALTAEAKRGHGLAPSFFCYDELALAKDRELLDALLTSTGKRARSLGIVISTQAPRDDHPLSQLLDDALNDPTMVAQLISAPEDCDPFDMDVIAACNPALGFYLNKADVVASTEMARRSPPFLAAHRNLRLNQRVDANVENRIVTPDVWEKGNAPVDIAALAGRECFAGLDLSRKHDLTALVLAFPNDDDTLDVLPFLWTPLEQLDARRPAERDLFKQWIRQGYLLGVPGPVVRYDWVVAELAKLATKYQIKNIAFDRWDIEDFQVVMADDGLAIPMEPFGQGYQSFGPAVQLFMERALEGRIRHGGHPALAASVLSAIVTQNPAGALKPDKEKSSTAASFRIDGLVALLMAIAMACRPGEDPLAMDRIIRERGGLC